jgi:hypothetical protein
LNNNSKELGMKQLQAEEELMKKDKKINFGVKIHNIS